MKPSWLCLFLLSSAPACGVSNAGPGGGSSTSTSTSSTSTSSPSTGTGADLCAGVVCKAASACQVGACDPATGSCTKSDGASCDDGDPCTQGDACVAGECVAGPYVDCVGHPACASECRTPSACAQGVGLPSGPLDPIKAGNLRLMADFDGDGRVDAADVLLGQVDVWLAQAGGHFQAVAHVPIGTQTASLAEGDIDGDGHPDIIVADAGQWLRNLGGGLFAQAQTLPTYGNSVVATDVDGDGKTDLVFGTNRVVTASTYGGSLSVIRNLGNGNWTSPISYPVGQLCQPPLAACPAREVVAADFDGDGHPDLAARTWHSLVAVLHNNGDGTFGAEVDYAIDDLGSGSSGRLLVSDLDENGHPDLVGGSSTINVLLNQGASFAPAFAFGDLTDGLVAADLDADGAPDLIGYGATIWHNRGDGTFDPFTAFAAGPEIVGAADVDGDAKPDLIVAGVANVTTGAFLWSIGAIKNLGSDLFLAAPTSPTYGDVLADLDGDGLADLVLADQNGGVLRVSLNTGSGMFGAPASFTATFPGAPFPGDLNGDGKVDLVVPRLTNDGDGGIDAFINQGGATFAAPAALPLPVGATARAGQVVDLNGDGNLDIVLVTTDAVWNASLGVMLNTGNGTFAAPTSVFPLGLSTTSSLRVTDLDGDGLADVALATLDDQGNGALGVAFNQGMGVLAAPVSVGSAAPTSLVVGDLDADGRKDLLVAERTGHLLVFHNAGQGSFAQSGDHSIDPEATGLRVVGLADLDGSGKVDVILQDSSDAIVMLNHGDGTLDAPMEYASGGALAGVADLNGDGRPDLLANTSHGAASLTSRCLP